MFISQLQNLLVKIQVFAVLQIFSVTDAPIWGQTTEQLFTSLIFAAAHCNYQAGLDVRMAQITFLSNL